MIDLTAIITPLNILLLTVLLGYLVGKIKIAHISLGLSGILFVAIILGIIIKNSILSNEAAYINELQMRMKTYSSLGSAAFVSVIGINAGMSLKANSRNNLLALAIGMCMTLTGVLTALVIGNFATNISQSTLLGVLCGALTSTPALSAVCDGENIIASEAVVGYSSAYLFGVILAVLAVSFISARSPAETTEKESRQKDKAEGFPNFLLICFTAVIGNIIGNIEVPIINFSFGSTGGILCVGTVVGYMIQKNNKCDRLSMTSMDIFRNFGLSLFFVGTGLCAGLEIVKIDWLTVVVGFVVTAASVICGIVFTKVVFVQKRLQSASILAGGMTSSPALGVLTEKGKGLSVGQYSFSYFGALILLMLLLNIILS